jgi:hypothetical protein
VLTEDCALLDVSCADCVAGERRCYRGQTFGKLVVVSGRGAETLVELVDLRNASRTCPDMPSFPFAWEGTVGGYVDGKVLVCGGTILEDFKECHLFYRETNEWLQTVSMGAERVYAAGVPLSREKFWVTGGAGDASTEVLTVGHGFAPFVDLPEVQSDHNLVQVNETHYLLLGHNSAKVWMFDSDLEEWSVMPDMLRSRRYPAAGLVRYADGRRVVVVAGSYADTKSVEVLDLDENVWRAGPDLPVATYLHAGASVPFGDTFLIVGGYGDGLAEERKLLASIIVYDPAAEDWVTLPQQLAEPRAFFTAVLVPDDFAECV